MEIIQMLNKYEQTYPSFKQLSKYLCQMIAIVERDVRKLIHDPSELLTRTFQPAIWLLFFGVAMAKAKTVNTSMPYLDYLAPGILAQGILYISIFYGISLIWERDMGILHKILVSPIPRIILVIGRALASGIRGISQIIAVYVISFFLGVNLRFDPLAILGMLSTVFLGCAVFSTFSLIVATLVRKRERFMGIGQVLTMPLFFASNALYPIEIMPKWLQILSVINPLSYQVNALRNFMVTDAVSTGELWIDFGVGIFAFFVLSLIAARAYPKILY